MAQESSATKQSIAQQRFGGDFTEFSELFKMSGERPKEDVQRDTVLIDDLLADQEKKSGKKEK